jgi:hypothetical protein
LPENVEDGSNPTRELIWSDAGIDIAELPDGDSLILNQDNVSDAGPGKLQTYQKSVGVKSDVAENCVF